MASPGPHIDLVLVIGYFRSALPMLSVIRHLSTRLRVGIRFQALNKGMEDKTGSVQKQFEDLCVQYGAILCESNVELSCRLMLVQQYSYTDEFVTSVHADIKADMVWGMLTLASMGIEVLDAFIVQFHVTRLTVPDKKLADYLLIARSAYSRYEEIEMIEVGLPFREYPVFPEFSVDWIVAAPTLFSFHTETGKQEFLRNVIKLMDQMLDTDVVAYKPHNGNVKDYFTPRLYAEVAHYIGWIPGMDTVLSVLVKYFPRLLGVHLSRILTALLHARVIRRALPMVSLTPLADMSIEAFLPGVRKGIIGGLSNTMWGSLFFGVPYYNCIRPEVRADGMSELVKKSSENLLDLNMGYFDVPYCNGDINQGSVSNKIAFDSERHKNIVDVVAAAFES